MPRAPEMKTTAAVTWNVTTRTSQSWNSLQAEEYQRVVKPTGSHVPSQRVAKELVTTVAIIANRLMTKKPTRNQMAAAQSFEPSVVSRIIGITLSRRRLGHGRTGRGRRAP